MKSIWYKHVKIENEVQFLAYDKELPPVKDPEWWLFRGLPRDYPLQTSLERGLTDRGVPLGNALDVERKLLKEFKRRAHYYVHSLPNEGDVMGWLALMQHYGAPTRLLDWTYSFYIAAFFALAEAASNPIDSRSPCVVWALYRNAFHLKGRAPKALEAYKLGSKGTWQKDMGRPDSDNIQDGVNAFLLQVMSEPEKCVWAVNSFRLNERLSVQRGLFLCPGDVNSSFKDNLDAANPTPETVVRFELSTEPTAKSKMLSTLHAMNINYATLFPGLDGFARSLRQKLWVPGTLRPDIPSHL